MLSGMNFSVGRPVLDTTTKRWLLPLKQSVRDKSGELQAIIVATLPVDLLQTFWKDTPFVKRVSVGLLNNDGYLLSRYPLADNANMNDVYNAPRSGALRAYLVAHNFPASGHVDGFNALGRGRYLNVFHRLTHYPATLFVAMPFTELKTLWWVSVRAVYFLLLLLLTGVGLIYIAARRQQFASSAARERMHAARIQLAAVVESSGDAIISENLNGTLTSWNPGAACLFGYLDTEAIGQPAGILLSAEVQAEEAEIIARVRDGECIERRESRRLHKNQSLVDVEMTVVSLKDASGNVTGVSSIIRDITSRKRSEDEINRLAFFDALTGLPNRRLLSDRLMQVLALSKRTTQVGVLIYLDLDHFKNINDTRGHATGDAVLKYVALALTNLVRGEDTVSRIGGDEFIILMSSTPYGPESGMLAARILGQKIHALLAKPVEIDGHAYTLCASIGVSLFPRGEQAADDVIREADIAMYRAKSAGRNRTEFFETRMQEEIESRVALEIDLGAALGAGQFAMVFQPQVSASGKVVGAELLIRWQHPLRGAVSPAHFIPLAEQTGLIVPMGNWVLLQGCEILLQLQKAGHHFPLSINVSPRQFRQPDFVGQVRDVLKKTGADGSMLIFEVTEGLLIESIEDTVARMHELAGLGIRFSIDDFGTGYSSLAYLKTLPLYELKIDKSFVHDMPSDPNNTAIVQMIMSMAKHLGLRVVAEGVETQQQADFLFRINCDCVQGYLYARPMPVENWLATAYER